MLENDVRKPNFTLFFVVVWVFYSLNSRYFQVPKADIVRWVVLGILVLSAMVSSKLMVEQMPAILITFLLAAIPSVFFSIDPKESVVKIICFVVVVYGSYIYFSSLDSIAKMEMALKVMMVVMIAYQIQSVLAIVIGVGYKTGSDRATGITTNANTLGVYSNLAFVSGYYWFERTKGGKKLFFLLIMVSAIWTCLLCGSRGGFCVLCIISALLLFLRTRGAKRILIISVIAVVVFLMFSGKLAFLHIAALERLEQEGGTKRGALWDLGISVWRSFPIFGCGYAISNLYNTTVGSYHYAFHNSYLTILAEVGVWGVIFIGGSVLAQGIKIVNWIKMNPYMGKISTLSLCGLMMITLLVGGYSESFLFAVGSTEGCTFWMLFAWSLVYCKLLSLKSFSEEG